MSSRKRLVLVWAAVIAFIVVLFLLVLLQGLLDAWQVLSFSSSLPFVLILTIVVIVLFAFGLGLIFSPPAQRAARAQGILARAEVLDISWTFWWMHRALRRRKREYCLRLRVMREGAAAYEATTYEYFVPDRAPKKGSVVAVKIHPERPNVVIVVSDSNP